MLGNNAAPESKLTSVLAPAATTNNTAGAPKRGALGRDGMGDRVRRNGAAEGEK